MEIIDLVMLGILSTIISAIICVICAWIVLGIRMRDVNSLYIRIESLENSIKGQKGNSVKAEKSERMQEALAKGMLLLQQGKKPEEIVKELGVTHSDVLVDVAKKQLGL